MRNVILKVPLEGKSLTEISSSESRMAFCPHCYGGHIIFFEEHRVFSCDKCRTNVLIVTNKKNKVKDVVLY
jgi:hypothetical protein